MDHLGSVNIGLDWLISVWVSYYRSRLASISLDILNCRKRPKIIRISECRVKANQQSLSNISLQNYTHEFTSTESSKGGTLLYIDQDIKYKIREDLKLCKSKEVESTFLEIIENNQKNVIVGCFYKHPGVAIQEFTNNFICPLLEKLLTENKEVIPMGDYNINFLNSDVDHQTLDTMYSKSFFPTMNTPNQSIN